MNFTELKKSIYSSRYGINHTSPWHPSHTTNTSKPSQTREGLTAPKSDNEGKDIESYTPSKFPRGSPTKISNAAVNLLVNKDDDRHQQAITAAPDLTLLQEWKDFSAEFGDFFLEFAKFRTEYNHSTDDPMNDASTLLACTIDDNDQTVKDSDPTLFLHVIGELEKVNFQVFQLLEKLEHPPLCKSPSHEISNLQQPAPCTETQLMQILQCATYGAAPPAPNPKHHTAASSAVLWNPQPPPPTIHKATMAVPD